MSGIQNKNLLFYSTHPNDILSQQCIDYLNKSPEMDKQFIKICIHDPRDYNKPPQNIRLPKIVIQCKERGLIPLLAIAGLTEPVFAQAAISWLKESSLNQGDLLASNIHGQGVADSCSTIEQASRNGNSLFDTDFNIGFSNGRGEFNKSYASIDEACDTRIAVYAEGSDKKSASSEVSQKLEQLKFSRDKDTPSQRPNIGDQMPQQGRSLNNMPQMPQGGRPNGQMPQMPQMPQGGRSNGQMPQMPQMPQMQHGNSRSNGQMSQNERNTSNW